MPKTVINPANLFNSVQYGFSQIVVSQGSRIVHLAGQVGWDENQQIVGKNDLGQQTAQAFKNMQTAMELAGGTLAHIVSLRIYIHQSVLHETRPIRENLRHFFPDNPPAATWIGVVGLANPDFLIEIEAVAILD